MDMFLVFLIEVSFCLILLFGVYHLFLRQETYYNLNRIYLISSVILSLIIPIVRLDLLSGSGVLNSYITSPIIVYSNMKNSVMSNQLSFVQIIFITFSIGAILRLGLFVWRLHQLSIRKKKAQIQKIDDYNLVIMKEMISPFSFFNNIFINEQQLSSDEAESIIQHELVHVKYRHSYDLIFLELLSVILWFNPFLIIYKKAMKENHEFFTDCQLIKHDTTPLDYKRLLLRNINNCYGSSLSNNLNCSQIKRRFLMMSKVKSRKTASLKFLISAPVIIAALMLFSSTSATDIIGSENKHLKLSNSTEKGKSSSEKELKHCGKIILKHCSDSAIKNCKGMDIEVGEGNKKCCKKKIIKIIQDSDSDSKTCGTAEYDKYPEMCSDFFSFMVEELHYPEEAIKMGIEGDIYLELVIDKKGKVIETKIIDEGYRGCQGKGYGKKLEKVFESFRQEALRVVKKIPDFKPAMKDGKAVESKCVIPIMFKLK